MSFYSDFFSEITDFDTFDVDEILRGIVKRPAQLAEERELYMGEPLDMEILYGEG